MTKKTSKQSGIFDQGANDRPLFNGANVQSKAAPYVAPRSTGRQSSLFDGIDVATMAQLAAPLKKSQPADVTDLPLFAAPAEVAQDLEQGAAPAEVAQDLEQGAAPAEVAQDLEQGAAPAEVAQDLEQGAAPAEVAQDLERIKYLFHDAYQGPRYSYGLTYRPLDIATVPAGWIIGSLRDDPRFRHGVIDYPYRLGDRAIESFELTRVDHV